MNYNFIAPYYDVLSRISFLNQQQKAHEIILNHLISNDKILWLGGGSGWFFEEMDQLNLNLEIDYIEFSTVMMKKAKSRKVKNLKVNFISEDLMVYDIRSTYDVILTAFIFDHFEPSDCRLIMNKYEPFLKDKGKWIYIDFTQNQNLIQRLITKSMVTFFTIVAKIKTKDFPKIEYLFDQFELIAEQRYFRNYIVSRVYKK